MPGGASEGVVAHRFVAGRVERAADIVVAGVPQPGEYGDRLVAYCPDPVEEGVRIAAGMVQGPFEVVDDRQPLGAIWARSSASLPGHLAIDPLPQVVEVCQRPAQLGLQGSDFAASRLTGLGSLARLGRLGPWPVSVAQGSGGLRSRQLPRPQTAFDAHSLDSLIGTPSSRHAGLGHVGSAGSRAGDSRTPGQLTVKSASITSSSPPGAGPGLDPELSPCRPAGGQGVVDLLELRRQRAQPVERGRLLDRLSSVGDEHLRPGLLVDWHLIAQDADLSLHLVGGGVQLVAGVHLLAETGILGAVALGVSDHPVHLGLVEVGALADGDALLGSGVLVPGGHVQDAVGVDLEGHLDLGLTTRRRPDPFEAETSDDPVV